MTRASILFIAVATLTTTACKKKEEGATGSADKAAEGKAAEGKAGAVQLPKLGLQLDVPGEAKVDDAIGGEGHMLMGEGIGAMQVEVAKTPQTIDEAKSDAEMYTPKNLKTETLPDGWALTFDNTGSMGANYFVQVRRDIGGKTYTCSTTGSQPGQAAAVLAACKSLRK